MLTPGEPEERTRRQRLAEGVPLPDDTWAAIVNAARQVGVDERRIQQRVRCLFDAHPGAVGGALSRSDERRAAAKTGTSTESQETVP